MKLSRDLARLILIATLAFIGCAKSDPPAEPGTDIPLVTDLSPEVVDNLVPNPEPELEPPKTADAAVLAVIDGLKEGKPEAIWEFLPTTYQSDVNDIVHSFGQKMDPELWKRLFGTAGKVTKLLESKKEFILENPQIKQSQSVDAKEISANWDGLVGLLTTLFGSDLSDVEKLKSIDVGEFMAQTGGSLMKQLAALSKLSPDDPFHTQFHQKLSGVKATLISSNEESGTAVVKLESPDPEEEVKEIEFIRVDGKWIPKTLAESWEQTIERAKVQLEIVLSPESIAAQKESLLQRLDSVDAALDQLQATETAEDFNGQVVKIVAPVLGMLMMAGGANSGPGFPDSPSADAVTIIIAGKLDETAEDKLTLQLLDLVDNADLGVASSSADDEVTKIEVSPVADIEAFSKKIKFGKVIAVDAEKRTITVELTKPEKKPDSKKKPKPAEKPKEKKKPSSADKSSTDKSDADKKPADAKKAKPADKEKKAK